MTFSFSCSSSSSFSLSSSSFSFLFSVLQFAEFLGFITVYHHTGHLVVILIETVRNIFTAILFRMNLDSGANNTFVRPKPFTEKISFRFPRFPSYKVLLTRGPRRDASSLELRWRRQTWIIIIAVTRINLRLVRGCSSVLQWLIRTFGRDGRKCSEGGRSWMIHGGRFHVRYARFKCGIKYLYRLRMRIHEFSIHDGVRERGH